MTAIKVQENPARLYLDGIAAGSRWSMRQALESAARHLSAGEHGAESFPWWEVRYQHTAAVRRQWAEKFKPATVNKLLAGLRGVLKQTWRLGLVDADTYRRAVDIENVSGSTLQRGRALEQTELGQLFKACLDDRSPAGRRDAAILAVFYGTGMRRAELAGLDLLDLDLCEGSVLVRNGKRRKQRTCYISPEAGKVVEAWLQVRGEEAGPLFCPIRQAGEISLRRLGGESVAYILRRRQQQTGSATFTPHDLRRTFVSALLEAGVDTFTVQKLAGHADPTTTARYDRRGETAKRRAAQSLSLPLVA